MWVIVKFDKKYFNTLKQQFSEKLGGGCSFYRPKLILQNYKKNKLVSKEVDLLDDYFFCYHEKFSSKVRSQPLAPLRCAAPAGSPTPP